MSVSERRRVNDQKAKADMTAYIDDDEKQPLSALVPSALIIMGGKEWIALVRVFCSMENNSILHAVLRSLRQKQGLAASDHTFPNHCAPLSELLRMGLLFHDCVSSVLEFLPNEPMVEMFFDRWIRKMGP